jgi:hypothetical protein
MVILQAGEDWVLHVVPYNGQELLVDRSTGRVNYHHHHKNAFASICIFIRVTVVLRYQLSKLKIKQNETVDVSAYFIYQGSI